MPFHYEPAVVDWIHARLKKLARESLQFKNSFKILSEEDLPLGPPPQHTRSISWLAEEVIRQNIKFNKNKLGVKSIDPPNSDLLPYDSRIVFDDFNTPVYINFKVSNADRSDQVINDISEITKVLDFFSTCADPLLFEMIFKINFEGFSVKLDAGSPIIFFLPWLSNWGVNRSQHKIQAPYMHPPNKMSPHDFLVVILKEALDPSNNVRLKKKTIDNLLAYCKSNPVDEVHLNKLRALLANAKSKKSR